MKCKPGFHHVKKHQRMSKDAAKHIVEEHCRKNPKSKEKFLYRSNLNFIYEEFKNNYKYKKLKQIKGYPQVLSACSKRLCPCWPGRDCKNT